MGKKKHKEPFVARDLYVYDTNWFASWEEDGKLFTHSLVSLDVLEDQLNELFPNAENLQIYYKTYVHPFVIN